MPYLKLLMLLFFTCFILPLSADTSSKDDEQQSIWLSGTPPSMDIMKQLQRSHGGYVLQGEDNVYSKMLWLREGDELKTSSYLPNSDGEFFLLDRHTNERIPTTNIKSSDTVSIKFKMPDEGYYNAYYLQRHVIGNVKYVDVAKSEVLKHSCRLGHDFDINKMQPQQSSQVPLEILRLRFEDENYHTRFNSGKEVRFKVLFKGQPLAGADVTIRTEEGWVRQSKSDAEGIASFRVIQDRFNQDNEEQEQEENSRHQRQRSEQFLISVQYKQDLAGEHNGEAYLTTVYRSTFPGMFSAPSDVYKSSAYALLLGSGGFLVLGVGTYLYRRRRIKPFKEVDLDE